MIISKIALPRRTFLRGLGAAIALPVLDAMVPAMSVVAQTAANPSRRLAYVYIPMGMNPAQWMPGAVGRLTELSPTLSSLAPHLDYLTVVSNLELRNANTTGNHASANCAFLSCAKAKRTEGSDYELGTTVDQIAAQQIGRDSADSVAGVGHRSHRASRQLRQRLRVRLPEQPVVVVRRRRRCRPKRIRGSCSSGCLATADHRANGAPSCAGTPASSTG